MNLIIIFILTLVVILLTIYKPFYILAIFLVGQFFLKLMIAPFGLPQYVGILYFVIIIITTRVIFILNNKINIKFTKSTLIYYGLILLWLLIMICSLIQTPIYELGINKILSFVSSVISLLILTSIFILSEKDFFELLKAIAIIALIVGIISVGATYLTYNTIIMRMTSTQSAEMKVFGVSISTSIWFGRRMGLGCICAIYYMLRFPSKKFLLVAAILMLFSLLSVSRGPIIALLLTVIILLITLKYKERHIKKYKKYFLAIGVIASTIIVISLFDLDIAARLMSINDSNATNRLDMLKVSLDLFTSNPCGIGIGGFEFFNSLYKYPHNIFAEILCELGILGVIIFLFLCFQIFYLFLRINSIQSDKKELINYCSLSIFIFSLINAQFSGDITSNEGVWWSMLLMINAEQFILHKMRRLSK